MAIFYSNRAHCHQQRDAFAEAEADASAALAIDATYVKALCRRGFAREKLATAAGGGRAVELLEAAVLDMTAACILSGFQNDTATGNTDPAKRASMERLTPHRKRRRRISRTARRSNSGVGKQSQ